MRIVCALVPAALLLLGCSALPNPMARAQEAAQEFNTDTRYGRNEIAIERVAPAVHDAFLSHHRAWGSKVQIADVELEGLHRKSDHEAEVTVRVNWYRPEEQELRTTTLKQIWRDQNGWKLAGEERLEGDIGLLGEAVVFQAPEEPKSTRQFPTVRLQGASE
ncbi:MAG TPA: hypothetical protein VEK07_12635 [Polyangiaceae bacterium]|nr:hypothetical protein [Polyangiaceae bacterium]